MTYCVAMRLNAGLVFLADSRTNAGVDQISTFRKMTVFEHPGERLLVLLSAGNLAITQAVKQIVCERTGKGLGVGIMSAALKKGELRDKAYQQMIESTTKLNTPGVALADMAGVHALTDVTGFGLLGHLLEICRGSKLTAEINWSQVPVLSAARHLVEQGFVTGASDRNWTSYGRDVALPAGDADIARKLLTDPQTAGGLLVACAPDIAEAVHAVFRTEGFRDAAVIGRLTPGAPQVKVK